MKKHTWWGPIVRDVTPLVLGLLLLGYVLDALYLQRGIGPVAGAYKGLVAASTFLGASFGGLLVGTLLVGGRTARTWLILLLTTLIITAVGMLGHRLALPEPPITEEQPIQSLLIPPRW